MKDTIVLIVKEVAFFEKILSVNPSLKRMKQYLIDSFDSEENIEWLGKAEYIISDTELPTFFAKKAGQIYIQILHTENYNANFKRLLLHADYIIEQNNLEILTENLKN
ncbi:hypothetical protein HCJ09_05335 [Listeria welshimeri]|nr:hypothetical protein [Listeria welshimeri]